MTEETDRAARAPIEMIPVSELPLDLTSEQRDEILAATLRALQLPRELFGGREERDPAFDGGPEEGEG